ncbi:MAG: exodeoxyribonuclease VII large subunit [Ruminococcus sp.]|nr:exodeoxyribonuclease VII large subunit [Ruminococcus sp.]
MSAIISVSQLNRYIALKLGGDLKLKSITVRGELSDFKLHYKSGHAYFELKDESSVIKGVMFSRQASRLNFTPKSGMSVLCSGSIEVYEPNGAYQIIATELIPTGLGAQLAQLNALKERLAAQGVFAQERKKALPKLPRKIAVVTSLGAAALQDVIKILKQRYPIGEVEVFAAQVQGERAHITIAQALEEADKSGADVIILTRGGGSYIDLAPFNTEQAVLAVANCKTPIISAVGHETDTTLVDYAADERQPTPSAAAQCCAVEIESLINAAEDMDARICRAFENGISRSKERLFKLDARVKLCSPDSGIKRSQDALTAISKRLDLAYVANISRGFAEIKRLDGIIYGAAKTAAESRLVQLERASAQIEAMNPYKVLERGYAIALKDGSAVYSSDRIKTDDRLTIRFNRFDIRVRVEEIFDENKGER